MAKKILILDTGKEWGGGTNSLIELLKRTDKKRFRFTALFYSNYAMGPGSDIKTELERLGVEFMLLDGKKRSFYSKGLKEAGRAVLFLKSLRKKYVFYIDYIDRILPDSRRIASVLKEGGFDMLYMNNQPSSNLEGILAAKAAGTPCIQHSRVDVRLNSLEAQAVNNWVDRVICVSRGVMDGLVESGVNPDRCRVVYNGIDRDSRPKKGSEEIRKTLGLSGGRPVVGTVGSLIKRKRIDLLIEAMGILKRKKKDAFCLVVGGGPQMDALKAKASALGVDAAFTGFSTDALSCINAMDVFVMPSEKEGLPRVILEAMLMGRPAVAFDVTGTGELIEDGRTGYLIKDGDVASLSEAIERIIEDKALGARLGQAARNRVAAEFGIDRYVRGVTGVFDEVLS